MCSIALLANRYSGSGGAGDVAALLREHGATVHELEVDEAGDAVGLAPDRLAVAGGDGSLAPAALAAARAGIPLAVVPTGTANDFARVANIPAELDAACALAVNGERVRLFEVGTMDERPFLNVAGLGLAPAAARRAKGLKGALGPLAYLVGALRAGLTAAPVNCRVSCDGQELFAGEAWQVSVACSGAFGAGSSVEADPADGRLDVVVVEARSRIRLAQHAYALRTGGLGDQGGVLTMRGRTAAIGFEGTRSFNVDGELVTSASCAFEVAPQPVAVVVAP